MNEQKFTSDKKVGTNNTFWIAVIAMIIAPVYMYIAVGIRSPVALALITLSAAALAFAFYAVRGLVGGVEEIIFSDEQVTFVRKKKTTTLTWKEITLAEFESINTTPWLTFVDSKKKKHRLCLEDFEDRAHAEITQRVLDHISKKTKIKKTWTVLNRIPVSNTKKDVEPTEPG